MRLYALCDQELLDSKHITIKDFIEIAIKHNAEIIQYRNKNSSNEAIKQQLLYIRDSFSGTLIINDLYELIDFCDGVHLGQEDLLKIDSDIYKASEIVRKKIGKNKFFGISTHNEKEIFEANKMDLNYIGLGAYRETSTKRVSTVLGRDADLIASISKHPVGIIGGVRVDDKFVNITYHVIGNGLL